MSLCHLSLLLVTEQKGLHIGGAVAMLTMFICHDVVKMADN